MRVTAPSTCPWLDHPVSGLMPQTILAEARWRPIKTRFPCAYASRLKLACNTKSLTHYTKGTQSGGSSNCCAIWSTSIRSRRFGYAKLPPRGRARGAARNSRALAQLCRTTARTGYRHNKIAFAVSWPGSPCFHDDDTCRRGKAKWPPAGQAVP